VPQPQARPDMPQGGRGDRARGGEGRGYRQPRPQQSAGQNDAPAYRPAPQPRADSGQQDAPRQRDIERTERPD
jgi:hypothetical protein